MKSFENYRNLGQCRINGTTHTQWEKKYDDGETARVAIKTSGMTREAVRYAFQEQEHETADKGADEYLKNHI